MNHTWIIREESGYFRIYSATEMSNFMLQIKRELYDAEKPIPAIIQSFVDSITKLEENYNDHIAR